jgi:hypothetical protein
VEGFDGCCGCQCESTESEQSGLETHCGKLR